MEHCANHHHGRTDVRRITASLPLFPVELCCVVTSRLVRSILSWNRPGWQNINRGQDKPGQLLLRLLFSLWISVSCLSKRYVIEATRLSLPQILFSLERRPRIMSWNGLPRLVFFCLTLLTLRTPLSRFKPSGLGDNQLIGILLNLFSHSSDHNDDS